MAHYVMLPHWGMELAEGVILKWLKREGDAVQKGDVLAEVEMDKAVGELESPVSGVLARILAPTGTAVLAGANVALIAQPGEALSARPSPSAHNGAPPGKPLIGMRAVVARRMQMSAREVAPVTLTREIDVTVLESLRPVLRKRHIDRIAVFIKGVADSLKEHPAFNGHYRDGHLDLRSDIHIGFAVELPGALIVPVVRDADAKTPEQISAEVHRLATKARDTRLNWQEAGGSTFTISSLGSHGIDAFTPIINPPELAILGIGRIMEKPAVHNGVIAIRSLMWLSITFDHRTGDGAGAARLLKSIGQRLEDPTWLATG